MESYLRQHLSSMEKILANEKDSAKLKDWLAYNRVQIGFLQHERLIHLLITLFFAAFLIIIILASLFYYSIYLFTVGGILLILLAFYLKHYYVLENGVQRLYRLDQEMEKHLNMRR